MTSREFHLDQWLSTATRGLCDAAVQRIRGEITDHYSSILTSGRTAQQAIQSLGNAKAANRQYRRVYLTKKEEVAAAALASPKESLKQAIGHDLRYLALVVLVQWAVLERGFSLPALLSILFWLDTPLVVFYPPITKERCRNHLWIFVGRILLWVPLFAYIKPAAGLIWVGIWIPLVMSSYQYRRWKVVRKLASSPEGIPIVPVVSGPILTDSESRWLQSLRRRRVRDYAAVAFVCLAGALIAFLSPLVGGPLLVALAFTYLVPRFVSIQTLDRGRRYRRIKWYLFALAAVVPPCYVIFGNSEPDLRSLKIFAFASIEVYLILFLHVVREWFLIRLRNKLPFEQWPERLHQ